MFRNEEVADSNPAPLQRIPRSMTWGFLFGEAPSVVRMESSQNVGPYFLRPARPGRLIGRGRSSNAPTRSSMAGFTGRLGRDGRLRHGHDP